MTKLHRVLTAVDFTESARAAFDHALALSRFHDAELMVVHAVPANRPFTWDAPERIDLIGALRGAAQSAGVRFKASIQHRDPAGAILLPGTARKADLIVLGTSKQSWFDGFRFGSVAERVALEATQPVLVVPPESTVTDDSIAPFKSILVALDFREGSMEIVERAVSMAHGDSRITVVHVVRGVPLASASRYMYHLMEPEYQRQLTRDAWRRMPAFISADATTARRVHARVVTGDPAAAISRVAAEADADLIIMGAKARGAFGRMIFGSTAARVIRTAGRPVLVVPRLTGEAAAAGDEGQQELGHA